MANFMLYISCHNFLKLCKAHVWLWKVVLCVFVSFASLLKFCPRQFSIIYPSIFFWEIKADYFVKSYNHYSVLLDTRNRSDRKTTVSARKMGYVFALQEIKEVALFKVSGKIWMDMGDCRGFVERESYLPWFYNTWVWKYAIKFMLTFWQIWLSFDAFIHKEIKLVKLWLPHLIFMQN